MFTVTRQSGRRGRLPAAVATGLIALFLPLSAPSAHAIPDPPFSGPGASAPEPAGRADVPRPCFLVRAHWNVALDGPQPLC